MLFFALLGLYLLLVAKRNCYHALAGISFGFALACKWNALFLILPTIIYLLWRRKYLVSAEILSSALIAYALTYIPLILVKGLGGFVSLQVWMLSCMWEGQRGVAASVGVLNRLLRPFVFISKYNPLFRLAEFHLFGDFYLSLNEGVNPMISFLAFPILYWQIRRNLANPNDVRQLLLFVFAGYLLWTMLFVNLFEAWLYAPITTMASLFAADFAANSQVKTWLIYLYLASAAIWPFCVAAILK